MGLDHDVGQTDDGVLHARGQAVTQDLLQKLRIHPQLRPGQGVDRVFLGELDQTEPRGDRLGDRGGDGGPFDPQPHGPQEEPVQEDVQHGGDDQIVEGPLAVAYSVHNALEGVVHDQGNGTREIPAQIGRRVGDERVVQLHPARDPGGQDGADDRQREAADRGDQNAGVDGLGRAIRIPGAEIAADDHARAHGSAHEEADHQMDQAAGGGDGREGAVPQIFADDPGVGGGVELLEKLAQEDREGEGEDDLFRVALRHQRRVPPRMLGRVHVEIFERHLRSLSLCIQK